jgi:hypothetical protein
MKEHNYNKATWRSGPWDDEPDRLQFKTSSGLPGLIVRNPYGALCGYVGVANEHPFYGKSYNDLDVEVHGGLTYADACQVDGPICHVPEPGEPDDVWWFGFDCAHAYDLVPGLITDPTDSLIVSLYTSFERLGDLASDRDTYRDINYVRNEVENLANQLVAQ